MRAGGRAAPGIGPTALALAALLALVAAVPAAGRETIVRQHLDAGRVQFSGMDINGDGVADSVRVDRIKQTLVYFVGDQRKGFRPFDPSSLPEEDRRFVPDTLLEKDLDGDEIEDLLIFNREHLAKYAADEGTLRRIIASSVYLGQPRGAYVDLQSAAPSEEARAAIVDRARALVSPAP